MNLFHNQPVSIRLTVEDVHDGVGRPGGDGDGGVVEAAHVAVAAGVDKVAAGGAGVLVAQEAALLRGRRRPGGFEGISKPFEFILLSQFSHSML